MELQLRSERQTSVWTLEIHLLSPLVPSLLFPPKNSYCAGIYDIVILLAFVKFLPIDISQNTVLLWVVFFEPYVDHIILYASSVVVALYEL